MQPEDTGRLVLALVLAAQAAAFSATTFDPLVRDGIQRGAYPGAVLVIGRRDTILFAKGYGRLTWSARSATPDVDSTLWDVASSRRRRR